MASYPTIPVHVLGAGPSGALTALALAKANRPVVLHDPLDGNALLNRSRAYAITHSSRRLFHKLGLWQELLCHCVPFSQLHLQDEACDVLVKFTVSDLDYPSRPHNAIGWILDHLPLMQLLLERLHQHSYVQLFLGRCPPPPPPEALIVAADGPRSPTRESWNIGTLNHRYRQGCLTAKVVLRGAPKGVAYELFRPEGPFAILPLSDDHFQVVWSAPFHLCQERADFSSSHFLDLLAAVLPEGIEPDLLLDQPAAIPQQLMLAKSMASGRGVLLGEAAHRCHPVGGQGLNLCWRDVSKLMVLTQRKTTPQTIAFQYGLQRWPDVLLVSSFTDLLVRLFSNRFWMLLVSRWLLLKSLKSSSLLRRFSLRAMTNGPLQMLSAVSD